MSCPVPVYLKELAASPDERNTTVQFDLRCPCGCGRFFIDELARSDEGLQAYKIRCCACSAEYPLFDARIHGYEGMIGAYEKQHGEQEYVPFGIGKGDAEGFAVIVKVENEPSLGDFNDSSGEEYSYEQYADGFSWIWITVADSKGKKHMLCDCETA